MLCFVSYLSNGGHIVDFDYFGLGCENIKYGFGAEFQAADHFLDPFLTQKICEKSSNQADYTPNRYSCSWAFQNDTHRLDWSCIEGDRADLAVMVAWCV